MVLTAGGTLRRVTADVGCAMVSQVRLSPTTRENSAQPRMARGERGRWLATIIWILRLICCLDSITPNPVAAACRIGQADNFQKCGAVGFPLVGRQAAQNRLVAGQLTVIASYPCHHPDQRIKPVENDRRTNQELRQEIAPLVVRQLVATMCCSSLGSVFRRIRREQKLGSKDPCNAGAETTSVTQALIRPTPDRFAASASSAATAGLGAVRERRSAGQNNHRPDSGEQERNHAATPDQRGPLTERQFLPPGKPVTRNGGRLRQCRQRRLRNELLDSPASGPRMITRSGRWANGAK